MGTPPGNFGDLDLPRVSAHRFEGAALGMGAGALLGTVLGFLAAPKTGPVRRWTFTESGEAVPE